MLDFDIDWEKFSGDFQVSFDNLLLKERINFGLEASGKTKFYYPMFHSPLGAPASYGAIEMSHKTEEAIIKGLHETLPRLMGAGRNRETGHEITYHTPPSERISEKALAKAKSRITKDYSVSIYL